MAKNKQNRVQGSCLNNTQKIISSQDFGETFVSNVFLKESRRHLQ